MDNVILSPHLTFYTREAMTRLEGDTLERCREALEGRPLTVRSRTRACGPRPGACASSTKKIADHQLCLERELEALDLGEWKEHELRHFAVLVRRPKAFRQLEVVGVDQLRLHPFGHLAQDAHTAAAARGARARRECPLLPTPP